MLGKSPIQDQSDLFKASLKNQLNPKDDYYRLAQNMNWKSIENQFVDLYSNTGTPSKPIRLMVGLLMIKQIENLSDERVVEAWVRNPYFQFLCGEQVFRWEFPCTPSDLTHFRNRIGTKGVEFIFEMSVRMNSDKLKGSSEVKVDTTVQEKNITFPTDTKLHLKIIERCRKLAMENNLPIRQSYVRVIPRLRQAIKFGHHPRRKMQALGAQRKIKTIAGRLYREVFGGLDDAGLMDHYDDILGVMGCVLTQRRLDKDKIYSIHEPMVSCIAKGKLHKPYEFGNKVSLAIDLKSNVVVGVQSFTGNPYDGHTLAPTLEHVERVTGIRYDHAVVDMGYKGYQHIGTTRITRPDSKTSNAYQKRKKQQRLRKRAGIEPLISHLKHDHRMLKNYLKGIQGDQINALMAAAAFNFKIWMKLSRFWLKNYLDTLFDRFWYNPLELTLTLCWIK